MLSVQLDEEYLKEMFLCELENKMKLVEKELVFWDSRELERRTCMSWNTIQKEFFFDKRFSKRKIGNKWYFPAEETKKFLLTWLNEK